MMNHISSFPKVKQFFKGSEIRAHLDDYPQQILILRDNFRVRSPAYLFGPQELILFKVCECPISEDLRHK